MRANGMNGLAYSGTVRMPGGKEEFTSRCMNFCEDQCNTSKFVQARWGERRVTNFLHLAEVLHRATINNRSHLRPYLFGLEQKWSKDISEDEYQLRLESQSESIRILTIHKSKGLEFPIVFLPGLSFTSGGYRDDFKYHREDGKLVVDLKKV